MNFWQRVQGIGSGGLIALAEIFLLTVVIYAFFKFLRGSRGAAVLRGVLLLIGFSLGILFVAASLLELQHITWLFEKLAALFIVGLMIIFQPELRRGLLRLGMTPFFQRFVKTGSPVIEEIVQAATRMSQRSMGGLIAIERQVPLTLYIEAGTTLNSEITADLLETIFFPGTLLHDGAVVIKGNRVIAAGCLLPLTENPELSKQLGTRHRAAIGISEETDAVALVFSEETGKISLCVDGKLSQGLTPDELRQQLITLCIDYLESGT